MLLRDGGNTDRIDMARLPVDRRQDLAWRIVRLRDPVQCKQWPQRLSIVFKAPHLEGVLSGRNDAAYTVGILMSKQNTASVIHHAARPDRGRGRNCTTTSGRYPSTSSSHFSACSKSGKSVELSCANSAGRRNGVSAPCSRATAAISSSSVETITRVTNSDRFAAAMLHAING